MAKTVKAAVVPPRKPLDYALWDGTEPVDSQVLGGGLSKRGWANQVSASAQFAIKQAGQPAVLQPAGIEGMDIDSDLLFRGMFEFPRAVLGDPLRGDPIGHGGDIVAVSGHGVPGFMFSNSLVPLAMSRPMLTTATTLAASVGNWSYVSNPQWRHPRTKIAIFSACRQLQGAPQHFYWSQTMRGSKPLHAILSYRQTGPSASASAGVNRRFLQHLKNGSTFIKAWKAAHIVGDQPGRWAALCYEASVGDSLVHWVRHGELPSHPDPKGTILYFDKDTPLGRAVKEMKPDVDCWLTARGSSARIPPWFLCAKHGEYDLHVRLLTPGENFQPGDRILIAAAQVRPDYHGPFSIQNLFAIDGENGLRTQGVLKSLRTLHAEVIDEVTGQEVFGDDSYVLSYQGPVPGQPFNFIGPELILPIRMGEAENDAIPLYYFTIAVRGAGARSLGWKSGEHPRDAFQYGMFLLPWKT